MAIEEGIDIRIGADTGPAQKGLNDLQAQLQKLQIALQNASNPKVMDALEEGVNKTKLAIANLTPAAQNMSEAIAGASSTSLRGSAIRAQYALSGIERALRGNGMQGAIFGLQQTAREFGYLTATTGSMAGAFSALGVTLLGPAGIVFGLGFGIELLSKFFGTTKKGAKEAAEAIQNVAMANQKGAEDAQKDTINLNLLYTAATNVKKSMSERLAAVQALQDQYPKYFKNLSDETILTGKAANAYHNLANQILASAKAKAYEDAITENAKKQADIQAKIYELTKTLAEQNKTAVQAAIGYDHLSAAQKASLGVAGNLANAQQQLTNRWDNSTDPINKQVQALQKQYTTLEDANNLLKNLVNVKDLTTDPTGDPGKTKGKGIAAHQQELLQTLSKYEADARVISLDAYSKEIQAEDDKYNKLMEEARKYFANKGELQKVSARITQDKAFAEFEVTMKYLNKLVAEHDKFIKSLSIRILTGTSKVYGDGHPVMQMKDYLPDLSNNIKANLAEFQSLIAPFQKLWQNLGAGNIDIINEKIEEMADKLRQIKGIGGEVGDVFQSFFTKALSGQANAFQSLVKGLEQLIIKMIAAAITAAMLGAALSLIPGAGVVGGTANLGEALGWGKSFADIFGSLRGSLGVPFANGGIISGPTLAMVGEYPGATSNPEVIAPLDKLQNIMGNGAGNGYIATAKISGNDLWIGLQRASQRRDRIS